VNFTSTPSYTPTAGPTGFTLVLGANIFNNLSDPPLKIDYFVFSPGNLEIRIYSVSKTPIRVLVKEQPQTRGLNTVYWSGKDDNGEPVSTGLYFVALTENGYTEFKKVLVLKR